MSRPAVLSSLLLVALVPFSGTAQTPQSARPTPVSNSHLTKWTEIDKEALLKKALQEDVSAQFWLGTAYEQGWFGKADYQEALKWSRRAAKRDDPDAQNGLGKMYENGEGVPQNYAQAAKWYRKAAEHVPDLGGAGQGRNNLGMLYLSGQGVPKDLVLAYMWFLLARTERNFSEAKAQMTPAQIAEAERMAADWINSHPDPQAR